MNIIIFAMSMLTTFFARGVVNVISIINTNLGLYLTLGIQVDYTNVYGPLFGT